MSVKLSDESEGDGRDDGGVSAKTEGELGTQLEASLIAYSLII